MKLTTYSRIPGLLAHQYPPSPLSWGLGMVGGVRHTAQQQRAWFILYRFMPISKDNARLRSHQRVVPPSFPGVAKRAADLSQIDLNDEFQHALDLIERQGQSVFLTGKAGTGKSTFLHYLRETTAKATVVLAPTGVAALNVGGQTIHSFFQFPPTIIDPQSIRRRRNPKLFQKLQTLII
ncbi:MAG TPA: AAA family ATPase, partial [Candidatus Binatia bacterium]|nr:AAA family ATPase [Candidatus Binatia bacterium]